MPLASKSASRRSTTTTDDLPTIEIVAGAPLDEKSPTDDLFTNDILALGSIASGGSIGSQSQKLLKGSLYTPQILSEPRSRRRVSLSPERTSFPPPSTTKRSKSPTKTKKKAEKTKKKTEEENKPSKTKKAPPTPTPSKTVTFLDDSPKSSKSTKKSIVVVPEDDLFFMGGSSVSKKTSAAAQTASSKPSKAKPPITDSFMEFSAPTSKTSATPAPTPAPAQSAASNIIENTNNPISTNSYIPKPRSALESMPYVPPTPTYSISSQQQAPHSLHHSHLNNDLSILAAQRRLEEKVQQHQHYNSSSNNNNNNRDSFGNPSNFNMMQQSSGGQQQQQQQHSNLHAQMQEAFQRISLLTNKSEDGLSSYKEASERKFQKAEELIEALKNENQSLKKELKEAVIATPINNQSNTTTSSLQKKGNPLSESITNLYESMCGLRIVEDQNESAANVWHCSVEGKHGHFTFDLSLQSSESADEEEGEDDERTITYVYTPTFGPSTPIANRLPSYLQCEISFAEDQLQLFFWRALNFLMSHQS